MTIYGCQDNSYTPNNIKTKENFPQWGRHEVKDSNGKTHTYLQFKGPPVEIN